MYKTELSSKVYVSISESGNEEEDDDVEWKQARLSETWRKEREK